MAKRANVKRVVSELKSLGKPECIEGMVRYGIQSKGALAVPMSDITRMAKKIGTDHDLAQELWETDIFDARVLASFIDDPDQVTKRQMERWVKGFDSWAICDGVCNHLFSETKYAYDKAFEWTTRDEEFVKRAGFALMASLTVHDKKTDDATFLRFLPLIVKYSKDDRVYVKKAVNWALRQIGKRNLRLNAKAIEAGERIGKIDSKSARWIASDALRELRSSVVQKRLRSREQG